jgi:hypothetical protein
MGDRKLEPLRDGSSFAGTPEVVDLLLGLLGTTRDPRWVMQFDATYLSPSMALRADGTFGGPIPGATLRCNQDGNAAQYDLEALTAAIQAACSTGVVAKCAHGIVLVSLDPCRRPYRWPTVCQQAVPSLRSSG